MNTDHISWKIPWRKIEFEAEIPALQNQLELEISNKHILWDKKAKIIGRRIDTDDVVVKTKDNLYAIVHLDYSTGPGNEEYPSTDVYKTFNEFIAQMQEDSDDYGEE